MTTADAGSHPRARDDGRGLPFALAFYGKARQGTGNVLVSPPSVKDALGIAYLGAQGRTAREMAKALDLAGDARRVALVAKEDHGAWTATAGKAELSVANRLWIEKTLTVNGDFATLAGDAYGAAVEGVDFAKAPDAQRGVINGWVSKETKGKIPELLPTGVLTPLTRVVITNAVYFKGAWAWPFAKAATRDEPFAVDGKTKVPVPTMHVSRDLRAGQVSGAGPVSVKVLEMPYAGSDLAMLVVLPDDPAGLPALEDALTPALLDGWTTQIHSQKVNVSLPKFTFRWGGSVKPQLKALGMSLPFEPSADFTGIADAKALPDGLYIADVIHKTFVAVDEEGTEASAATGVVMATRGAAMPATPLEFKADHPFFFVIRDTKRGNILFAGRVTNPKV